jgi:hypothetical protein
VGARLQAQGDAELKHLFRDVESAAEFYYQTNRLIMDDVPAELPRRLKRP